MNKTYKADIGMDEVADDLFTCIVYCVETGEHLCLAYGKTPEECTINAEMIALSMSSKKERELTVQDQIHLKYLESQLSLLNARFAGEKSFSMNNNMYVQKHITEKMIGDIKLQIKELKTNKV